MFSCSIAIRMNGSILSKIGMPLSYGIHLEPLCSFFVVFMEKQTHFEMICP